MNVCVHVSSLSSVYFLCVLCVIVLLMFFCSLIFGLFFSFFALSPFAGASSESNNGKWMSQDINVSPFHPYWTRAFFSFTYKLQVWVNVVRFHVVVTWIWWDYTSCYHCAIHQNSNGDRCRWVVFIDNQSVMDAVCSRVRREQRERERERERGWLPLVESIIFSAPHTLFKWPPLAWTVLL